MPSSRPAPQASWAAPSTRRRWVTPSTVLASRWPCSPPTATRPRAAASPISARAKSTPASRRGEKGSKGSRNGGKFVVFVGLPGADNARERIEGFKDTIKGSKIELVDVRADDIDRTRSKRNVEDTLTAHPEINCMVGYYSYNTPDIYTALKDAVKLGQITVIGFDEDPITLGGVKEGTIASTVVQQPYEWGYKGMTTMAKYLDGDKSVVPAGGLMIIPTKIITKDNVDAFWAELKERQGKK